MWQVVGVPRDAWLLYGTLVLSQNGMMILVPLLPTVQQEFAVSYSEASLAWTGFGLARLIVDLPAGALVARFERRRLLACAIVFGAAALLYSAAAPSFAHLVVSRILYGMSSSIANATLLTSLVDIANPSNRGRVLAFQEGSWSVSAVSTPLIGGTIAVLLGWRVAFVWGALWSLLALGFLAGLPVLRPGKSRRDRRGDTSPLAALRAGGAALLAAYVLAFAIFFTRGGLVTTFAPLFGGTVLGLPPDALGRASATYSGVGFVVLAMSGPLMDRFGKHTLVAPAMLAATAGALWFLFVTGLPSFMLGMAILGLSQSAHGIPTALLGDLVPGLQRPAAAAFYRFVGDAALLTGPIVIGLALDHLGPSWAIGLAVGAIALALIAYQLLVHQRA